ncbi:serine O-acetyltransferase [Jeotgalibaca sp. A122]|uniref:serine O-acetyltransferase n=1 Tax=Jeotgalibaca sp. A122 TaxID=3457322 RepID=UPI003FCFFE07
MKISKDLDVFTENKKYPFITKIFVILINPCFQCVALYRFSHFLYQIRLLPLAKIVWYINRLIYCCDIDYKADLAGGFRLVHGLGVVIGAGVQSKGKLTVYQGVTLGGTGKHRIDDKNKKIYMPVLGSNVTIYTDAKVFGPVQIEDNVVIKAGSLVVRDLDFEDKSKG